MERTNAFVVKWQTGRNGDTFHGLAIHGILVETEKRCSVKHVTIGNLGANRNTKKVKMIKIVEFFILERNF